MSAPTNASNKTVAVLSLIAEGHSYSQIVESHPDITYRDIFKAAEEALQLLENPSDYHQRMEQIKAKHPRAYERWSDEEEAQLTTMWGRGTSLAQLAIEFERQPSAIRSRIAKLGLDTV